jgi:hypothetical protein
MFPAEPDPTGGTSKGNAEALVPDILDPEAWTEQDLGRWLKNVSLLCQLMM